MNTDKYTWFNIKEMTSPTDGLMVVEKMHHKLFIRKQTKDK
jgi:hypothetical protein